MREMGTSTTSTDASTTGRSGVATTDAGRDLPQLYLNPVDPTIFGGSMGASTAFTQQSVDSFPNGEVILGLLIQ